MKNFLILFLIIFSSLVSEAYTQDEKLIEVISEAKKYYNDELSKDYSLVIIEFNYKTPLQEVIKLFNDCYLDKNNKMIKPSAYKVVNSNDLYHVFIQIPSKKDEIYFGDDYIIYLSDNWQKITFPESNNDLNLSALWYFTKLFGNSLLTFTVEGIIKDINTKADTKIKETFEYNYAMGLVMKKDYPDNIDTNLHYFYKAKTLDSSNQNLNSELYSLLARKDSLVRAIYVIAEDIYLRDNLDSNDFTRIIQYCDSILKGNVNFINYDTLKSTRYMKAYSIFAPYMEKDLKINKDDYEKIKILASSYENDCKFNLLLMNAHISSKNIGEAEIIYNKIKNSDCPQDIVTQADDNYSSFIDK